MTAAVLQFSQVLLVPSGRPILQIHKGCVGAWIALQHCQFWDNNLITV